MTLKLRKVFLSLLSIRKSKTAVSAMSKSHLPLLYNQVFLQIKALLFLQNPVSPPVSMDPHGSFPVRQADPGGLTRMNVWVDPHIMS